MGIRDIFSQGKKEWRRRRALRREAHILKEKNSLLGERRTLLGEKAWNEGAGMEEFGDIKKILLEHQAELEGLKRKSDDCLKRKSDLENLKVKTVERFTSERQDVAEKKKAVDSRLDTEKEHLKTLRKTLALDESRAKQIVEERNKLQQKIIDAETSQEQRLLHEQRLGELSTEEEQLLESRRAQSEAIKTQSQRTDPVQIESDQLKARIDEILGRQKQEIGGIEKELKEIQGELDGHAARAGEVEADRKRQFNLLGEKLAAAAGIAPSLGAELAAVRETEGEIEKIQAQIDGLDDQRNEASSGAYRKMMAIIIGGVLLVIALVILAVMLLSPEKSSPLDKIAEGKPAVTSLAEAVARSSSPSTERRDIAESEDSAAAIPEGMEKFADSMRAVGEASREKIGTGTPVASVENLSAALAKVPAMEMSTPTYNQASFSNIETASLRTTYRDAANRVVEVEITDTHSMAILLTPYRSMMAMDRTIDNGEIFQKTGSRQGIPFVETLDKENGAARLVLIVKDRYIINLETDGDGGLDRLRSVVSHLNPAALD